MPIIVHNRPSTEEDVAAGGLGEIIEADSLAFSMGQEFLAASHSTGLMFANAVKAHGNINTLSLTGLAESTKQVSSVDTMADAMALASLLAGEPRVDMLRLMRSRIPG